MTSPCPPPPAIRLLRFAARDADWADAVVGDLHEEFLREHARLGSRAARRWYWRQAIAIAFTTRASRRMGRPVRLGLPDVQAPSGRWLADLGRDLRAAWRSQRQQPGVAATIVLALAVGIAANATIFALGDAIVLRPFRFPGADRTVLIASSADETFFDRQSVSRGDFIEWRERSGDVLTHLAAIEWWDANLTGGDLPERLGAFRVSADYFTLMGIPARHGRMFTPADELPGAPRVVVLAHGLWVRRFGASPTIVGRSLRLDGERYQVVGVAPAGFGQPFGADLWAPLVLPAEARADHAPGSLMVVGRLRDGVTLAAVRARMDAIVAGQRQAYPQTNRTRALTVRTYTDGFGDPGAPAFIGVWQIAAIVLLLVSCANVTNLLLARGAERQREFAIRLALGAGRARIVSQLLLEALLLATVATIVALAIAFAALEATRSAFPPAVIRFVPGWDYLRVETRTVLVAAAAAAFGAVAASLVPALRGARSAVAEDLRPGFRLTATKGRQRVRVILAVAQVALTVALVTAAGLTVRAVQHVTTGPLGFNPAGVLTAEITLPAARYGTPAARAAFVRDVLERLRALPSIQVAAALNVLPYSGSDASTSLWLETLSPADVEPSEVDLRTVTADWTSALQVPLLSGRPLSDADRADAPPVALVSATLARRFWPGQDAIGRRFRLDRNGPLVTVVGTTGDVARYWILNRQAPTVYRPFAQAPTADIALVLRVAGDPIAVGPLVRSAVAAVDPEQPVAQIRTYPQVVADATFGLRFAARALAVMAVVALLVSLVGVYSLVTYIASQRTREMGVRAALGATAWDITRLTVGQGGRIALGGVLGGAVLAVAVGRLLESALFGVVAADYGLTAVIGVLLGATAVAASYVPARRAARVDPVEALRAE